MNIPPILQTAVFCLLAPSIQAATLMQTNFDSLASGTVTAANLNAVTIDGTWTLNTTRGAGYTRSGPVGDYALLADDNNGGNAGVITFATIVLDSVADFSTDAVTWSFGTATRRTGTNKGLRYEFLTGATSVATLDWVEGGGLTLTGDTVDTGTSGFQFLFDWFSATDPRGVREMTFTFDGTTLSLTVTDPGLVGSLQGPNDPLQNASLSVALGSSSIDRLVVYSTGSENAGAKGVFLSDMLVTQVPEPSAALLGGIGALMLLRRRRSA